MGEGYIPFSKVVDGLYKDGLKGESPSCRIVRKEVSGEVCGT